MYLKKKILLAVGHKELEDYLKGQLTDYEFVGESVYKEIVIKSIKQTSPDIVIIRETLPGKMNIISLIYEVRTNFPDVRIIFLAGNRKVGDELLATLVNYGVYDILYGENIHAQEIVGLVKVKNTYNDIKYLQPVPLLDEKRDKILFEAPKEIIKKEVIIKNEDKEFEGDKEISGNEGKKEDKNNNEADDKKIDSSNSKIPIINHLFKKDKKEEKNIDQNVGKNKSENKTLSPESTKSEINKKEKSNKEIVIKEKVIVKGKIIAFVGGKSGVGNTSIAVNTAFSLAKNGSKVIFVELNEKYPAVPYWYDLGFIDEGIDTFAGYIKNNDYEKINKTIITKNILENKNSELSSNYKCFPDTLDFLFFSKEYLSGIKEKADKKNIKDLYFYLLHQLEYDFVILDVPSDVNDTMTYEALMFSNMFFSVITQDISSIGYLLFNLKELGRKGVNIEKNNYIINKYISSDFGEEEIKEWLNVKKVFVVPELSKDFILANFEGIPVAEIGNSAFLNAIKNVTDIILN